MLVIKSYDIFYIYLQFHLFCWFDLLFKSVQTGVICQWRPAFITKYDIFKCLGSGEAFIVSNDMYGWSADEWVIIQMQLRLPIKNLFVGTEFFRLN